LTREPNFDELIGAEVTGAEREQLQHAHELLLQAGPVTTTKFWRAICS